MLDKLKDMGNHSYFWSGFGAVFGMLSLQEWLSITGILIGLFTAGVNFYYKRQDERRRDELHEVELALKKQQLSNK